MRPIKIALAVLTNDPNGIAEDQTPAGVGSLTLDGALVSGGVGTFAVAQPVGITSDGNDSGVTFTVTGTDANGITMSETLTGPSSTTVYTTAYFKTVTGVTISGAGTGNISVGVAATQGMVTQAVPVNWRQSPFNMSLFVDITAGTMTYTVEHTPDDPEAVYTNGFSTDAAWYAVDELELLGADAKGNLMFPARALRLKQTVGSATGAGNFWITQGQNG